MVAFAVDFRKNWWALIPSFVLAILCLVIVFGDSVRGEVVGSLFMFAIAIPFAVVYLIDRKNWWALIPAFTMTVFGSMVLLSMFTGLWAGAIVTLAISAAFFYVYFKQSQYWWALLPAGILGSIGINALLTLPVLGKFAQSSFPAAVLFLGWAATFGWLWRQRRNIPYNLGARSSHDREYRCFRLIGGWFADRIWPRGGADYRWDSPDLFRITSAKRDQR